MWEERTLIKEFYRSDWHVTMPMRVCFDWWLMWEGPTHYGWHIPKKVGLDSIRKQAEHEPMNEIVDFLHGARLQVPDLSSCHDFPPMMDCDLKVYAEINSSPSWFSKLPIYLYMFRNFPCMYIRVPHAWLVSTKTRQGIKYPGNGVTNNYKLPCGWWELQPGPLEEQPVP